MAILDVLVYPDPKLREETVRVETFDADLRRLISDMRETMYAAKGVGLAAPQVGVNKRVAVIEWEDARFALVNPVIVEQEGEERRDEGCLSFPGIYEDVTRPTKVRAIYQDEEGVEHDVTVEGFLARIFSHEIDHLDQRLLIDNLSPMKRAFLKKKMGRKAKGA